jgi:hypothetical protein
LFPKVIARYAAVAAVTGPAGTSRLVSRSTRRFASRIDHRLGQLANLTAPQLTLDSNDDAQYPHAGNAIRLFDGHVTK